jgi:acyl-CoA thioester hydrolase
VIAVIPLLGVILAGSSVGVVRAVTDRLPNLPPLEHSIRVQLRWRDMDMLGHLNQSVYHELLEEGRAALMTEIVRRAGVERAHGTFVLVHVDLDYHTEVRKDHGEVEVVVRLDRVGNTSMTLQHEVRLPDGTLAASGATVLVAWDPVRRGKRELTGAERAVLTGDAA